LQESKFGDVMMMSERENPRKGNRQAKRAFPRSWNVSSKVVFVRNREICTEPEGGRVVNAGAEGLDGIWCVDECVVCVARKV
jgi:hypothetical protein